MNVIVDTNVIISGIFFTGPPFEILNAWKNKKFELIVSHEILDEYREVADELSNQFPEIDQSKTINLISIQSKMYLSIASDEQVTDDPKDEKLISCALASKTKFIVSGDKHLLRVSGYKGIQVHKPRDFLETYLK